MCVNKYFQMISKDILIEKYLNIVYEYLHKLRKTAKSPAVRSDVIITLPVLLQIVNLQNDYSYIVEYYIHSSI